MPNHFHFELRQTNKKDMEAFMRSLITKYTMYFNRKYNRVGPLFQGRYKAVLILGDEYLLHLSRYIHLNPLELLSKGQLLESYHWSSYSAYVNNLSMNWLKKDFIQSIFTNYSLNSYKKFVEDYTEDLKENSKVHKDLLLD